MPAPMRCSPMAVPRTAGAHRQGHRLARRVVMNAQRAHAARKPARPQCAQRLLMDSLLKDVTRYGTAASASRLRRRHRRQDRTTNDSHDAGSPLRGGIVAVSWMASTSQAARRRGNGRRPACRSGSHTWRGAAEPAASALPTDGVVNIGGEVYLPSSSRARRGERRPGRCAARRDPHHRQGSRPDSEQRAQPARSRTPRRLVREERDRAATVRAVARVAPGAVAPLVMKPRFLPLPDLPLGAWLFTRLSSRRRVRASAHCRRASSRCRTAGLRAARPGPAFARQRGELVSFMPC